MENTWIRGEPWKVLFFCYNLNQICNDRQTDSSGSVMVRGWFHASWLGLLAVIDRTMNFALLHKIPKKKPSHECAILSSSAFGICCQAMIWNKQTNRSASENLQFFCTVLVKVQTEILSICCVTAPKLWTDFKIITWKLLYTLVIIV